MEETKKEQTKEELLKEAFQVGCSVEEAICNADMSKQEWMDYLVKNKDFLNEIETLRLKPIIEAKKTLANSLKEARNSQWYLTHHKDTKKEWGDQTQLSGADGKDFAPIMLKL